MYDMSKKQRLENIEKEFKKFFIEPDVCGSVDEFNGWEETYSGLWLNGESGNFISEDVPAFDYWNYAGGVHEKAMEWADNHNVYFEWHDAGTMMLYFND